MMITIPGGYVVVDDKSYAMYLGSRFCLVRNPRTGVLLLCKPVEKGEGSAEADLLRALNKLCNKNIVKLMGFVPSRTTDANDVEAQFDRLLLKYGELGSLGHLQKRHVDAKKPLPESFLWHLFASLTDAVIAIADAEVFNKGQTGFDYDVNHILISPPPYSSTVITTSVITTTTTHTITVTTVNNATKNSESRTTHTTSNATNTYTSKATTELLPEITVIPASLSLAVDGYKGPYWRVDDIASCVWGSLKRTNYGEEVIYTATALRESDFPYSKEMQELLLTTVGKYWAENPAPIKDVVVLKKKIKEGWTKAKERGAMHEHDGLLLRDKREFQ